MGDKHMDVSACVHCHKCRKQCSFLEKYQIDIGDTEELNKLAYHCFLCGKCTAICPRGIDGKDYILELRRKRAEEAGKLPKREGYGMLLAEKRNYLFRNYRHALPGSVLFPGCNFPSFYPKTARRLVKLMVENGIGTAYDCCGKPVAELGLLRQEKQIVSRINEELRKREITEVIMVCPNCYEFLKDRLSVRVISIYDKLSELEIGEKLAGGGQIFLPCPDWRDRKWLGQIEGFTEIPFSPVPGLQCCGLGGSGAVKEPELAGKMADKIEKEETVFVYCASCGGNLARNGCRDVRHVLAEILGTGERPDTGKSVLNRAITKFI